MIIKNGIPLWLSLSLALCVCVCVCLNESLAVLADYGLIKVAEETVGAH